MHLCVLCGSKNKRRLLYSINWLVCITETECVYCAVRTGSLYIIPRSAHTVYLCVLCGSQNKQRQFPCTSTVTQTVFTARYGLSLHIQNRLPFVLTRTCHGSGGESPASHRGCPGSTPSQSAWDLCRTKWHWDRFFSEYSGILYQFRSTKNSTLISISIRLIGQAAETWEPLGSSSLSDIGNHWIRQYVHTVGSSVTGRCPVEATVQWCVPLPSSQLMECSRATAVLT